MFWLVILFMIWHCWSGRLVGVWANFKSSSFFDWHRPKLNFNRLLWGGCDWKLLKSLFILCCVPLCVKHIQWLNISKSSQWCRVVCLFLFPSRQRKEGNLYKAYCQPRNLSRRKSKPLLVKYDKLHLCAFSFSSQKLKENKGLLSKRTNESLQFNHIYISSSFRFLPPFVHSV